MIIFLLVVMYIAYSLFGLVQVQKYLASCDKAEITPFNGSIIKMFAACLLAGGITTVLITVGTLSFLFEPKR